MNAGLPVEVGEGAENSEPLEVAGLPSIPQTITSGTPPYNAEHKPSLPCSRTHIVCEAVRCGGPAASNVPKDRASDLPDAPASAPEKGLHTDTTDQRCMNKSGKAVRAVSMEIIRSVVGEVLRRMLHKEPFGSIGELGKFIKGVYRLSFVGSKHGIEIERRDIKLLRPGSLLNDKIINIYFEMLQAHAKKVGTSLYVFSTYFYTKLGRSFEEARKWVEDINIFDYSLVFIPVHLGNHWAFVAFDAGDKKLEYFDSLGGYSDRVAQKIAVFLLKEHFKYYNKSFYIKIQAVRNATLQRNCTDCGVFALHVCAPEVGGSCAAFQRQLCSRVQGDDDPRDMHRRDHIPRACPRKLRLNTRRPQCTRCGTPSERRRRMQKEEHRTANA